MQALPDYYCRLDYKGSCNQSELAYYYNIHALWFIISLTLFVVTLKVKSRKVTVTGPRGTLYRDFSHLQVDIRLISKKLLRVEKWFGTRKELAAVNTVCSHIQNLFTGVQVVS